jgi:competence ComEA-like helix-hairpin-helix protein
MARGDYQGRRALSVAVLCASLWTTSAVADDGGRDAMGPHAIVKGCININTATVPQLLQLPGVGPGRALAIVKQRQQHPFGRTADIMKVRGIGPKLYQRMAPYLTVVGPTSLVVMRATDG